MQVITTPGPTGSVIPLTAFGIPVAADINELITDIWTPITTAWTAYTPTWTSSGTQPALVNGTIAGRYMRVGKVGFVNAVLSMGAGTTYGTGTYALSLPSGWTSAGGTSVLVGVSEAFDSAPTPTFLNGLAKVASGATTLNFSSSAGTALWGQTVPLTWASGDTLRFTVAGIELT